MRAGGNSTTYCRFEEWELDYVSRHIHEPDVELAERIGRTTTAVFNMRIELERLTHRGCNRRCNRVYAV